MRLNEGVALTGRTGGGKSTLLRWLMKEFNYRHPCLWLTVKPDEADIAESILYKPFRFAPGTACLNVLTYEMGRKGGNATSLSTLLQDINEVLTAADRKGEAFWETMFQTALMHAINIVWLAKGEEATLTDVYQLLMTTPESIAATKSEAFLGSYFLRLLKQANQKFKDDPRVIAADDFFGTLLASAGEKVRGAVISQAANVLVPFTMYPLSEMVSGKSTVTPESMLKHSTILDLDILTYGKMGQAFQLLVSFLMQEAVLRNPKPTPYVRVADEYQYFAHAKRDIKVQTVARSQLYTSIIAFQSMPVLVDGFGGGIEAKVKAEAIYSLHVNKFMCNNNCVETNNLNAEIIGRDRQMFFSSSTQPNQKLEWWDFLGVGQRPSVSMSQQFHYRVPPATFTQLRTGGAENKLIVEAVYHNGSSFQKVSVKQCLNNRRKTRGR